MLKIVERAKYFCLIPIVIILLGIIFLIAKGGFVQDVDFAGGMTMYVEMGKEVDFGEVADVVKGADASINSPKVLKSDGTQIIIQTTPIERDVRNKIITALKEHFSIDDAAVLQVEDVTATMGAQLRAQAMKAALIACLLMLIYISIRFEFFTGASAVICLLHDVLVMLAFYVIFRIPINANFIAAMLTIIGYSINNTIVVFDRVRENQGKVQKSDLKSLVNTSLKQTLRRSCFTTLTTIIPVILLYILGVDSIKEFALPLMVGLLAGTYSSVLLAGPIWVGMKTLAKKRKYGKKAKARA